MASLIDKFIELFQFNTRDSMEQLKNDFDHHKSRTVYIANWFQTNYERFIRKYNGEVNTHSNEFSIFAARKNEEQRLSIFLNSSPLILLTLKISKE